jgi:hypothetical protein
MPKGYRGAILAVAAWLILTGQHPDPEGLAKQAQTDRRVGDALTSIAATYTEQAKRAQSPDKLTEPCNRGVDVRYSDLCAQWKAADAASDSAWWAWAGGLLGMGSLIGVLGALYLAFQANRIARDTAARQLRAYVNARSAKVTVDVANGDIGLQIALQIFNSGATPAKIIYEEWKFGTRINRVGAEEKAMWMVQMGRGHSLERVMGPASDYLVGDGCLLQDMSSSRDEVEFRIGALIKYTDFLGREWSETSWWNSERIIGRDFPDITTLHLQAVFQTDKAEGELQWSG